MKFPFVLRSTLEKYQDEAYRLMIENSNLRLELKKAMKNDHRDKKTGKFIKG